MPPHWNENRLTTKLGIDYPVIQGPLGGLSSQKLTAAVSNFGGLGSFGAHSLTPGAIKDVIAEIRCLTSKPFAMNLWVSMEDEGARTSDENAFNRSLVSLAVHIAALGSPRPEYKPYSWIRFEDQARVLLDEKVPVFSFIYGIPPQEILKEYRAKHNSRSIGRFEVVKGQDFMGKDFMGKRLALLAIRLFVSMNLLYAAIFLKFAGAPGSVTLFTQMSKAVHGLVSQPVFRLGSGVFETVVAVLLLIPKTARLGARLTVVWMTAVILSHIFVLGYGWFFIDALMVMLLAVVYLLLTRRQFDWGEPESVVTMASVRTHKIVGRTVGSGATRS